MCILHPRLRGDYTGLDGRRKGLGIIGPDGRRKGLIITGPGPGPDGRRRGRDGRRSGRSFTGRVGRRRGRSFTGRVGRRKVLSIIGRGDVIRAGDGRRKGHCLSIGHTAQWHCYERNRCEHKNASHLDENDEEKLLRRILFGYRSTGRRCYRWITRRCSIFRYWFLYISYSDVKKLGRDFIFRGVSSCLEIPRKTKCSCLEIPVSVSLSDASRYGDRRLLLPMTRKEWK